MKLIDLLLVVGLILIVVGLALITPPLGAAGAGAACVFVWLVTEADE